jgi:hypothetical protein
MFSSSLSVHAAVLTRDCQLHLFGLEEDLATHPDVINAIFKPASGGVGGFGGSGSDLQAISAAVVDAAVAEKANAAAKASAAARAGADGDSEDIADAAAAAGVESPKAPRHASTPFRLPGPALPPELIAFASAYAARVDDLTQPQSAGSSPPDPLAGPRKAGTPPSHTFELSPSTKLAFAPNVHVHAFELSDSKGSWFSANKLLLRAVGQEDMLDWTLAINNMVDACANV